MEIEAEDGEGEELQEVVEGWVNERDYEEDDYGGDVFQRTGGGGGWVFAFMNMQRFQKGGREGGRRGTQQGTWR